MTSQSLDSWSPTTATTHPQHTPSSVPSSASSKSETSQNSSRTRHAERQKGQDSSVPDLTTSYKRTEQPVPSYLAQSAQSDALSFFFNTVVKFAGQQKFATSGWLGELSGLFNFASRDSLIYSATNAIALVNYGTKVQKPSIINQGRECYVQTIRKLIQTVREPEESRTDETLVSVLILGFYEFILSTYENRPYSDHHGNALPSLLRHRGRGQIQPGTRAHRLFLNTQNQIINSCIHKSTSAEAALGELATVQDEPNNLGARLRVLLKDINDAQVLLQAVRHGGDDDDESRRGVKTALETVHRVDDNLNKWAESLIPAWKFSVLDGSEICISSDYYWNCVHSYSNLWICRVWNSFRSARIKLHSAVLGLASWSRATHGLEVSHIESDSQFKIQQLVDDICASVPFCLGNQTPLDKEPIACFPNTSPDDMYSSHSLAMGWFLILTSLHESARAPLIPDDQRRWILHQLSRVCRIGAAFMGNRNSTSLLREDLPTFAYAFPIITLNDSESKFHAIGPAPSHIGTTNEPGGRQHSSSLVELRESLVKCLSFEQSPPALAGLQFYNTTKPEQIKDKETQKKIRRDVMLHHVRKHETRPKANTASRRQSLGIGRGAKAKDKQLHEK